MATLVEFEFNPKPTLRIDEEAVTQYLLRTLGATIAGNEFLTGCGITMRQVTSEPVDPEVLADEISKVGGQVQERCWSV